MTLSLLFGLRTKSVRALFSERRPEKLLSFFVGVAIAIFFVTFGYWFFDYVFAYLKQLGDVGTLLIGRVLSLAFFAVLILLFISNLLTGISTIFRNEESTTLISLPLNYGDIFTAKATDSFSYSTWAFAVLGLPMIAAYGHMVGFQFRQYLLVILLVFIPFTMIPSAVSSVILLLYFRFARQVEPKKFALLLAALIAALFYLYLRLNAPRNLSLYTYQDWRILNDYLSGMAMSSSLIFPSRWVSGCLQDIGAGNLKGALIFAFSLVATALFFWQIAITLSKWIFISAWQNGNDTVSSGIRTHRFSRHVLSPLKWKYFPVSLGLKNMIYKDAAIFFRDGAQWGQFSILVALMLVYLFNLRFFPANLSDPFWKSVIAFANFAFTGFVLATLSVRFVFPTISLEGKAFWALRSAPVKPSTVFWEKFAVAFVAFIILAEILAFISSKMLGLTPMMSLMNYAGTFILSIALTGLAVGMGAIYPNFEQQNPSRIASGAGGMLAAILSLIYVCVIVVLAAYPTHLYTKFLATQAAFDNTALLVSISGILMVSIIVFTIPVVVGLRSLKRIEI
jgi:ABC-2 type transport system permease protein